MKFKFNLGDQATVADGKHQGDTGIIVERQRAREGMPAIYTLDTGARMIRTYFEPELTDTR